MTILAPELHATPNRSQIADMVSALPRTAALDNEFYSRWTTDALPYPQLAVFAREYLARTKNTSVMVALSVLHTEDLDARVECVKNLFSEYGNGRADKAHLVLLESFLLDLLCRVSGQTIAIGDIRNVTPLPTTQAFSKGQREVFTSADQRVVHGALLAQEHLAYSMLTRLYEGVRNYKRFYDTDDEFHQACEYFYIHIGEAEKQHKAEAVISAVAVCPTPPDLDIMTGAFNRFVELTGQYWHGVAAEMRRQH